jgi:hypothetical protein
VVATVGGEVVVVVVVARVVLDCATVVLVARDVDDRACV